MYNPFSLKDKRILITGAGSGIGRSIAIECSRMGAFCILVGRTEDNLKKTASMLDGIQSSIIVADISTQQGLNSVVSSCQMLDGLVNNAGIGNTAPIHFINKDDIDRVFSTNTFAPIKLTQLIIKNRLLKKGGSLVFISSTDVYRPEVANAIYASSKAALTTFMRSCAKELAPRQIRSNAVMPGMTDTPFLKNDLISREQLNADAARYPLKRYGKPEDIAYSVVYLLSDATSWMTGSIISVDGGFSLI